MAVKEKPAAEPAVEPEAVSAPLGYVSDPSDPNDSIKEAEWNAAVVTEQMKQAEATAEAE